MLRDMLIQRLNTAKALMENNSAFYVKKVDKTRYEKGKKLEHHFLGVERDAGGNAVLSFAVPSESNPGVRRWCFIDIIPKETTLFNLAKTTKKLGDRVKILKDADVKCFCSCPDFNWSGAKYNMKHKYDALSSGHHADEERDDKGEDIPPNIRDPKRKRTLCKHLVAACAGILTNVPSIMKAAREIEPVEEEKAEIKDLPVGQPADAEAKELMESEDYQKAKDEAVSSFPSMSPVETTETKEALDTMAEEIEPSEEIEDNPGGDILGVSSDEEEIPIPEETTEEEKEPSTLYAYDDVDLDQFDVPLEDEDEPITLPI